MRDAAASWRLSLAEIGPDAPFSSLPGRDRILVVAEGQVLLRVEGDERRLSVGEASAFRGESEASAVALGGPAQVVNLMVVRGSAEFRSHGVDRTRDVEVPQADGEVVLLLWRGLTLEGLSVEPGTALLPSPPRAHGPEDPPTARLLRFPEPVVAYRLVVRSRA